MVRGAVNRTTPLAREAIFSAGAAACLAALLVWFGPPGADLAAHSYQRALFLEHGFALWNNFWYAGRYSFITYSVLYYPLAALFGIKLLAVTTISAAALAFAVVLGREWGPTVRWSSRTFAIVWAGIVLSAAFPFALGMALALLSIWALQAGRRVRFACLATLTLAASPVAFLLLAIVLAGIGISRRALLRPVALVLAAAALAEFLLRRSFPAGGRYPFSAAEMAAVTVFCLITVVVTWNVEAARVLRWVPIVYLAACAAAFAVPSALGENIARLRFVAIPLAVLALSLRNWRPLPVVLAVMALAASWNVSPLAAAFVKGTADPAGSAAYWQPAVSFLQHRLTPSYRVEAVDTVGHWAAVYLPDAGIPLARGWFRQDDFPQNKVLYSDLGPRAYRLWLRSLGVRYVVLTTAPADYSARGEASLLAQGRSGLRTVLVAGDLIVYELPHPRPIVTGPGSSRVLSMTQSRVLVALHRPGAYRVAIRFSPYWRASSGCVTRGADGMMRLRVMAPGWVDLRFHVAASRALATIVGSTGDGCRLASEPAVVP